MARMLRTLLVCSALLLAGCRTLAPSAAEGTFVHSVYFTLREDTPQTRAAFVAACDELLAIDGVVQLIAGERDPELARDVNDVDFDVALHIVFSDRAAHDAYQPHPVHQRLIAENRANWERVRVFDSRAVPVGDAP
jgi:hypothetical protein